MEFKINYDHKEPDNTITQIDKWYDKHIKLWCVQCKNSEGDQIGDALYNNKKGIEIEYNELLEKYGLK